MIINKHNKTLVEIKDQKNNQEDKNNKKRLKKNMISQLQKFDRGQII